MLAASDPTPNRKRHRRAVPTGERIPTPGNWRGVAEGIQAARQAVQSGQLDLAEQLLIEVLEFAPTEIKALKMLARVQRQLGHIEEGIRHATRALQIQNNPLDAEPVASLTLAKLLWQQHEYDEARDMLEYLISENPDNSELHDLRAAWTEEPSQ